MVISYNFHFAVGGNYHLVEIYKGFVLNLLMCLLDLNYKPEIISRDWEYGTKDDWDWLDNIQSKTKSK